jgi:hypothetical protein
MQKAKAFKNILIIVIKRCDIYFDFNSLNGFKEHNYRFLYYESNFQKLC